MIKKNSLSTANEHDIVFVLYYPNTIHVSPPCRRRLFDLNLKAAYGAKFCCHRIHTQWGARKSKEYKAQPNMLIECGTRTESLDAVLYNNINLAHTCASYKSTPILRV